MPKALNGESLTAMDPCIGNQLPKGRRRTPSASFMTTILQAALHWSPSAAPDPMGQPPGFAAPLAHGMSSSSLFDKPPAQICLALGQMVSALAIGPDRYDAATVNGGC